MESLQEALATRQKQYRDAVDRILDHVENDPGAYDAARLLRREAVELVGCLRRLVEWSSPAAIHHAFGAPGDFGYDTPIGDALAKLYRGGK